MPKLSQLAVSKLNLIKPPAVDDEILPRETSFMALLREDTTVAYRFFMDGASLGEGRPSVDEMSQLGARTFVRSLFSEIEAFGYLAQRLLDEFYSDDEISFSEEEVELLETKELVLKIAHFAEIFSRKFGYGRTLDKSGKTWMAFSRFAAFRDRITHPRDSADLQMDLPTLKVLVDAMGWYEQFLDAIEISETYTPLRFKT